jgi:uncharacterized protein with ATP-grasp and redox domains
MKVRPECLECVIRQARNTLALQRARGDSSQQILEEVKQQLVDIDWEQTPADLSNVAYRTIEKYLQVDPFAEAKQMQNQMALGFYPDMRQLVEQSKDRLLTAVRIAATGNVIDLGIGMKVDIAREVERILQTAFPVDDTAASCTSATTPVRSCSTEFSWRSFCAHTMSRSSCAAGP